MKSNSTSRQDLVIYIGSTHASVFRADLDSVHCLTRIPLTLDVRGDILSSVLRSMAAAGSYTRLVVSRELTDRSADYAVVFPKELEIVPIPSPSQLAHTIRLHGQHDPPTGAENVGPPQPIPRYPSIARL